MHRIMQSLQQADQSNNSLTGNSGQKKPFARSSFSTFIPPVVAKTCSSTYPVL